MSTSVAASDWSFYYGGVFDGCDYGRNMAVNHAVQLVTSPCSQSTLYRWGTARTPPTATTGSSRTPGDPREAQSHRH